MQRNPNETSQHQGHIVLRTIIDMSALTGPSLCIAHLLKLEGHRSTLRRGFELALLQVVKLMPGEPPPESKAFLYEFFAHTLLRSVHKRANRQSKKTEEQVSRSMRLWELFEFVAYHFNGYVDHEGNLLIFIGDRNISKLAVVQLLLEVVLKSFAGIAHCTYRLIHKF